MSLTAAPEVKTSRLLFYFGLMYFCQGVCQIVILLNQPIRAYFKSLNYSAEQTANFFFIANIPWIIKPLYGLISDFIPLFGYRRRSYLLMLNLIAAGGFLWLAGMADVRVLTLAAVLVGIGVAAADVIVDALMVEEGQRTGLIAKFQSIQWICINVAAVGSGFVSSLLLTRWADEPLTAVKVAAAICSVFPFIVAAVTFWAVKEQKTRLDLPQLRSTAQGLGAAFTSPRLLAVLAFLALLTANPGVYTPMNYHLTETLGIADSSVALSDSFNSAGCVLGAVIFLTLISNRLPMRGILAVGILANCISMIPFFFVNGKIGAWAAYGIFGIGYQIGNLSMLALAASACPKRAEGFVFAAMMSMLNFSAQTADNIGASLYTRAFEQHITPLLLISVGLSALALPILPFVPLKSKDEMVGGSAEDQAATVH